MGLTVSWQPSKRRVDRELMFERLALERTRPPMFSELEIGQAFFFRDELFVKRGPLFAEVSGRESYVTFRRWDEVTW